MVFVHEQFGDWGGANVNGSKAMLFTSPALAGIKDCSSDFTKVPTTPSPEPSRTRID